MFDTKFCSIVCTYMENTIIYINDYVTKPGRVEEIFKEINGRKS